MTAPPVSGTFSSPSTVGLHSSRRNGPSKTNLTNHQDSTPTPPPHRDLAQPTEGRDATTTRTGLSRSCPPTCQDGPSSLVPSVDREVAVDQVRIMPGAEPFSHDGS